MQVSLWGGKYRETEGIQHTQQTTCSVVLMLLAHRTLEGTLMTCPVMMNSLGPFWSDTLQAFVSYVALLACIHLDNKKKLICKNKYIAKQVDL